ncbi:hypothetical protein FOA43_001556 [Brettanomyces nanus]|uniref:Carbohydrate kinase FGGY C-terminal domain-containing protein n=1 Tax=Eeniella nana TaxID=13502 RepID=A0A875RXM8_EENNA|nr:uncharacterized protein FOA43_001556 [Brettanomyces nanus]QPG74231.1 hypothetical protein FOA43_001556 [Brettanomyces nanus]
MNTGCYIGIDVGSRSVRAVAVDADSDEVLAQAESSISYEVDPTNSSYITASQCEVWVAFLDVIKQVIRNIMGRSIIGICLDATCSLVVMRVESDGSLVPQNVDSTYSKISGKDKGIVFWMDHRSEALRPKDNPKEMEKLAGMFIPEMAVPKVKQISEDCGEAFQSLKFFDLHEWLEWMLITNGEADKGISEITVSGNCEPVGIDGSLAGFCMPTLNHSCDIPIRADQIGRACKVVAGIPFAGQRIGYVNKDISQSLFGSGSQVVVFSGLIDCYASFFANFKSLNGFTDPGNCMIMVAGTSACFLSGTSQPRKAPTGIWGGFRLLPEYWFYEGGFSCCGVLIDHLFHDHPCGYTSSQLASSTFWKDFDSTVDRITRDYDSEWFLNRRRFYSGDYLGNRTPYNDSSISSYLIGDSMVQDERNLISKYLLILEYIVLQARLMLECFVKDGFPLQNMIVCGSLAKNYRLMELLELVLAATFGIHVFVSNCVSDMKYHAAYGSSMVAKWASRDDEKGSGQRLEPLKAVNIERNAKATTADRVVSLMNIKYGVMMKMIKMQQITNDQLDADIDIEQHHQ